MKSIDKSEIESLKRENQLLREIFDRIHEGVYAIDEKGEILIYNRDVEKTEGMKREEVLGKTEKEIYSVIPGAKHWEKITKTIIETGKPLLDQYIQLTLPEGRKCDIIINSFPFFYKNELAGIYTIGHDLNTIGEFIGKTLEVKKRLARKQDNDPGEGGTRYILDDIVGNNDKIREAVLLARKIARQETPVLIFGETGTGKELFAQGIHNASLFAKGPFVPINCAAIPDTLLESLLFGTVKGSFTGAVDAPGLFEQAEDGTIFLDEINSMPTWLQAKLLRVLQEKMVRRIGSKYQRQVNCRIISATNTDPFKAIKENTIRSDLFFRLATVVLHIPALRERKEDIGILISHFINKHCNKYGLNSIRIAADLKILLEQYEWPGNIRELQNTIESSMNFVGNNEKEVQVKHLPSYFKERIIKPKEKYLQGKTYSGTLHSILQEVEKKVIEDTLQKTNGNISKTAEELGIFRQALHYRIKKFGIRANK